MSTKFFVSEYSIKAPLISDPQDLRDLLNNPAIVPEFEQIIFGGNKKAYIGTLQLDKQSPFYPDTKDLKIMRTDVIGVTVAAQEILKRTGLNKEDMEDVPLFLAAGLSMDQVDQDIRALISAYLVNYESDDGSKRNCAVNNATHPLVALKSLPNAALNFVAKYSGARGNNTTYGNTSHSSFYALDDSVRLIGMGQASKVLLSAVNCCGIFSSLTYMNFNHQADEWKDSTAAGCLLIESEESLAERNKKGLAEITHIKSLTFVPDVDSMENKLILHKELLPQKLSSTVVFSGTFNAELYTQFHRQLAEVYQDTYSWYPRLGNTGPMNVLLNIATAIELLNKQDRDSVDCIDIDPYGRSSYIKIRLSDSKHE